MVLTVVNSNINGYFFCCFYFQISENKFTNANAQMKITRKLADVVNNVHLCCCST